MTLQASGSVIPTGGVVVLQVSGISGGPLVTSRAIGSGGYVQIESDPEPGAISVIVDYGVGLQGPLPSGQGAYSYLIRDSATGVYVSGLSPTISLAATPDWLDQTVMRCVQAGIANLILPAGYQRPSVQFDMPRDGFPTLPFIFITPMSIQQAQTQIGQDVPSALATPGRQLATVSVQVTRTWRHTIYCRTAGEREFYRDVVLAIWQAMLGTVFLPLGSDMRHSFMVHSGQDSGGDMNPGFYTSDILYQVDGMFNVGLVPTYGIIEVVDAEIKDVSTGVSIVSTIISGSGAP